MQKNVSKKKPIKSKNRIIPQRKDLNKKDTWDLQKLFSSKASWEKSLLANQKLANRFARYEKTLKEDVTYLHGVINDYLKLSQNFAKINAYAMLRYSSDLTDTNNQSLYGKMNHVNTVFRRSTAFFSQELLTLSTAFLKSMLTNPLCKDYRQMLRDLIRSKPHVLSLEEEKILAEQTEFMGGFEESFEALTNTDLKFGSISTPQGKMELSSSTLHVLLEHRSRKVRQKAFEQYYNEFYDHLNVLSRLYSSEVQKSCAIARIRKHRNALSSVLHRDNIPELIYHNLIKIVNQNLPVLHRYYALMKKTTGLKDYAVYDTYYCPFTIPDINLSYDEAVKILKMALLPLGDEYVSTLTTGLSEGRWVDRYESKGKRSGAFSYPIYDNPPYIMMNYQSRSVNSLFTLAHEAGHSMHSWMSNQKNSFAHFHYSIFEAEIASTLNEYLLYRYMINEYVKTLPVQKQRNYRAYFLHQKLISFVSTFFRQTMFAEFEYNVHRYSEEGIPLTSNLFVDEYQKLSKKYYGRSVTIPRQNGIVGLRIPHFYNCFYVYQYATGISAAYSIGRKICNEYYDVHYKQSERKSTAQKTIDFFSSAGSRYPLESLALADIDFSSGKTIQDAIDEFHNDVDQLNRVVKKED